MYANNAEFQKVFKENMDGMYLLSFLLTTDHAKAEECFVSGLEDCAEGKLRVSRVGAIMGSADHSPKCDSHGGAPSK